MKKHLKIAALLLTVVLLTNVSCKKENPLDSINYDDPSFIQLVSLIGQDSATVAETLIKKGFRINDQDGYEKNDYCFRYYFNCKNGKITIVIGQIDYKKGDEARAKFREKNNDLINEKFTHFRASTTQDKPHKDLTCTKNPYDANSIALHEEFNHMVSFHAKKDLACRMELHLDWPENGIYFIRYDISGPDGEGTSGIDYISHRAYASCD